MAEMKNSALLDRIIERAKNLGDAGPSPLSAARFLVAVADGMDGSADYGETGDFSALLLWANQNDGSLAAMKKRLMQQITGRKAGFAESLSMQKMILTAKKNAEKQRAESLSPEILLACVLESPDASVAPSGEETQEKPDQHGFLSEEPTSEPTGDAEEKGSEKPEKSTEQLERDLDTLLQELLHEKTEESGQSTSKNAVKDMTDRIKTMRNTLLDSVYGQDHAVSVFTSGYFQAELLAMTDRKRVRPRATFLFAGPPGVGKTFLAEKAAEVLGLPFMRFDMSEYADKEANLEFCGSDKVYKNAKAGNVTGFVEAHPECVLLFDEIEKANICVIHLFLQLLDAGRLRDNFTDNEVSFSGAVIIFTTNAGRQLYEGVEGGDFSGLSRKVILKALQKDVNDATGAPLFPAAICSRFASGNVVMFNHISAHNLREIAKKEVLRHAKNFADEIGIRVEIDEKVYTALLYAEGGTADARMIRSRAESFFDGELFELFRLIASERVKTDITDLEKVSFTVKLPDDQPEVRALFDNGGSTAFLTVAADDVFSACREKAPGACFLQGKSWEEVHALLHKKDVGAVLIHLAYGRKGEQKYLNAEDEASLGHDILLKVLEEHAEMPVYLLQTGKKGLNEEEKASFLQSGVRGVVSLDGAFAAEMQKIGEGVCRQRGMALLAKSNRLVSFQSAQSLSRDGKKATVTLYGFRMSVAVEAEDSHNILSGVSKPDVRFDQVIGAEGAKKELRYFVSYLKDPKKYAESGLRAPRGVLLYGPPGTGKTMLAKAMAGESDVTFITAEGNQFLKKYVGEGPEKVHELFRTARKYAPAIIFVDEIDAIAKERRGGERAAAGEETLTAFLTEMDGFSVDPSKPVFVLAATNFNVEPGGDRSLDPALMRRFDRRVYIDLPSKEERMRYMHLKISGNRAFAVSEEELENLAVRSTGMSLAELESVFELSLRSAIRDGDCRVSDEILEESFETFSGGERKKWDVSQLERVARHEAGHALLCYLSGETPSYVTVVARADHGGYMQHGDPEGKQIYTKEELLARIRTSLGGRAAEIVYYGPEDGVSTGPSGDLASATETAKRMVCVYGMDNGMGLATIDTASLCSDALLANVHEAVNRILSEEMEKAVKAVKENRKKIDALVSALMAQNHLSGPQITEIFGKA